MSNWGPTSWIASIRIVSLVNSSSGWRNSDIKSRSSPGRRPRDRDFHGSVNSYVTRGHLEPCGEDCSVNTGFFSSLSLDSPVANHVAQVRGFATDFCDVGTPRNQGTAFKSRNLQLLR